MSRLPFTAPTIQRARRIAEVAPPAECDPRVEALVNNLAKVDASWEEFDARAEGPVPGAAR